MLFCFSFREINMNYYEKQEAQWLSTRNLEGVGSSPTLFLLTFIFERID